MRPPETDRRGKHPVPIWIDGRRFASSTEALAELGLQSSKDRRARYYAALGHSERFEGHTVSRSAPLAQAGPTPSPRIHRAGEPLLIEPCRHRLGVWLGGQW